MLSKLILEFYRMLSGPEKFTDHIKVTGTGDKKDKSKAICEASLNQPGNILNKP